VVFAVVDLLYFYLSFYKSFCKFPSVFDKIWDMNVVIIVIVPTIGSITGLAAPTSIPPLATTSAISPPEEDNPNAVLVEVRL
jgi:hypothetical protein